MRGKNPKRGTRPPRKTAYKSTSANFAGWTRPSFPKMLSSRAMNPSSFKTSSLRPTTPSLEVPLFTDLDIAAATNDLEPSTETDRILPGFRDLKR
jgi:hypothetical protein